MPKNSKLSPVPSEPGYLQRLVRLTDAQKRLISTMKPGQWYGDFSADDVLLFPSEWNPRTFRQMLRRLREMGILEKRMKEYKNGSFSIFKAFNVRLKPNKELSHADKEVTHG